MRVLLDTNVIVDVLQRREPWFADGQKIFYAAADGRIAACITAKEAADIYYFTRRQFAGQDHVDVKARQIMIKLYALFELIDTLAADCQNALANENGDYEDAIMIETAVRAQVDAIITRNPAHFKHSPVSVYSPKEFVNYLT